MFSFARFSLGLLVCLTLTGTAEAAMGLGDPRVPLLVVPGYMGTVPKMAKARHFPSRRDFPADELELASDYHALLVALEHDGYRREIDLFPAPWDWRLALAPEDGVRDGRIERLAGAWTAEPAAFAVRHLGHALARVRAARPDATAVDVLAHGLGGILVRTYLQSDLYGAAVRAPDGSERSWPQIRRLLLIGVPNQGQAEAWNPWHGDFSSLSPLRQAIAPRLFPVAFQSARSGGNIEGADQRIGRNAILRAGKPDPTSFYRLYDAGNRALLPTYPFLWRGGTEPEAIVKGPASNPLLLDLNGAALGSPPWVERVESVVFTHGTGLPTTIGMRRRQGPDPADPERGVILLLPRLGGGAPVPPRPRQIWFEPIVEPAGGDGIVPLVSLAPPLRDHPRVRVRAWAARGRAETGAVETDGPVSHLDLIANPDLHAWLVGELRRDAMTMR